MELEIPTVSSKVMTRRSSVCCVMWVRAGSSVMRDVVECQASMGQAILLHVTEHLQRKTLCQSLEELVSSRISVFPASPFVQPCYAVRTVPPLSSVCRCVPNGRRIVWRGIRSSDPKLHLGRSGYALRFGGHRHLHLVSPVTTSLDTMPCIPVEVLYILAMLSILPDKMNCPSGDHARS